jgi:hypothetical protein
MRVFAAIGRLFENDDESTTARVCYMWLPMIGSATALLVHLLWDLEHPRQHQLGRAGALITFFAGVSAYGGATRIWIRAGRALIRGVREVPYGIVAAILLLVGTLLWDYGDLLPW